MGGYRKFFAYVFIGLLGLLALASCSKKEEAITINNPPVAVIEVKRA